MNIMILTSLYDGMGGAEKVARDSAFGFSALGHNVKVVTTARNRFEESNLKNDQFTVQRIWCPNIYWVNDADRQSPLGRCLWHLIESISPIALYKIYRIASNFNPDVIFFHKIRGFSPWIWLIKAVTNKKNIVLIQVLHDYESISPIAHLSGRLYNAFDKTKLIKGMYLSYRRYLSKSVDVITAPSLFTLNKIKKEKIFKRANSFVVPNSHGFSVLALKDLREAKKAHCSFYEKKLNLLFIGRLEEIKGVKHACEVTKVLLQEGLDVELVVAGTGCIAEDLKRLYSDVKEIKFIGNVSGSNKNDVLLDAHIVLVPSQWEEVFGIVVIEAFAYGIPVLASNVGGLPELVEENKNGRIIDFTDYKSVCELICLLNNDRDLLKQWSSECFSSALKYTNEENLNNYIKAYASVVRG